MHQSKCDTLNPDMLGSKDKYLNDYLAVKKCMDSISDDQKIRFAIKI